MSDIIHDLLDWSKTQKVVLNGIKPNAFPGRGIGLISTRAIKEGDVVLEVPTSAIKTLDDLPSSLRKKLPSPPDTTVHALLALDLATDASSCPAPWRAVLPSRADIATMPLTWDERLHPYLPPAARELLKQQKTKFDKDFANCVAAVPGLDESRYRHAWLLVNSRTFYHTTQVAVRSLVVPEWVWRSFAEGRDEGEGAQWKVDTELKTMLEEYDEQIEATIKEVESLQGVGEAVQREIIVQRWRQIQIIVGAAIKRLAQ
ncbi:Response regulator mcs4 [Verticillium dahliae VDG1]|nr:Response regulator mcs4 [Verticillium dahliae VDG1]